MRWAVLLLAVVCLGGPDRPDKQPATSEKDLLQGTWKLVRVELLDNRVLGAELRIAGNKFIIKEKWGKVTECSFQLPPSRGIKKIDLVVKRSKGNHTVRGVYRIQGNTLTMCMNYFTGTRPTDFHAKFPTGVVFTWQKQQK